jgi:Flp pilus assembly CpaF family ATPase
MGTPPGAALDGPAAARSVYGAVVRFGPLQRQLDDPTVEEISIHKPNAFVRRTGPRTARLSARRSRLKP